MACNVSAGCNETFVIFECANSSSTARPNEGVNSFDKTKSKLLLAESDGDVRRRFPPRGSAEGVCRRQSNKSGRHSPELRIAT